MWDCKRDTEIKNRLLDSVEEGEGRMIWENSIETHILPYVKQITRPGSMHETAGLVHWDDPEGWDGVRDGVRGGLGMGEHTYIHGRLMSMYGENHYNIVK